MTSRDCVILALFFGIVTLLLVDPAYAQINIGVGSNISLNQVANNLANAILTQTGIIWILIALAISLIAMAFTGHSHWFMTACGACVGFICLVWFIQILTGGATTTAI